MDQQAAVVWYVEGDGDFRPARVAEGNPQERGPLDLIVLRGVAARTHNDLLEDPETGNRWQGPPYILVTEPEQSGWEDEPAPQAEEEALEAVAYGPNGEHGTWHEA